MKKQILIRIYPHGWSNTERDINKLNEYLNKGWSVKFITPSTTDGGENITLDYILEDCKIT